LSRHTLEAIRDERCRRDPLYWAQTWTKTENPHYIEQGLEFCSPFPQKSYFVPLFEALASEKRLFICKSREMLTSWSCMIWATHQAQWFKSEVIVQTESEAKAKELVGYSDCLYRNQDHWLKQRHPLKTEASILSLEWADGGRVFGIPHGEHKIRVHHPTIVIFDEAAFLSDFEQAYNVAQPVTKQIVAISSAGPGAFGDQCSV
jgi:hypothetical protein